MRISQEVKGVKMRNLCGTIFYIKTNELQDFHFCMSVPLKQLLLFEMCAHKLCEKFAYKHSEAIKHAKN